MPANTGSLRSTRADYFIYYSHGTKPDKPFIFWMEVEVSSYSFLYYLVLQQFSNVREIDVFLFGLGGGFGRPECMSAPFTYVFFFIKKSY